MRQTLAMVQKLERVTALARVLAQVRLAPLAWTLVMVQALAMVQRLAQVAHDLVVLRRLRLENDGPCLPDWFLRHLRRLRIRCTRQIR